MAEQATLASTTQPGAVAVNPALTNTVAPPASPPHEFFVSQRAPEHDSARSDALNLEEQEILANIQELQQQLSQLRSEEGYDSDEETSSKDAKYYTKQSSGLSNGQHLIVVCNTLPVVLKRDSSSGKWSASSTTGGLDKLMCLTGVREDTPFLWVGWVGQHVPANEQDAVRRLLLQHNCLPVFLSEDTATKHGSFSSDVIWSLFHYVSEPIALTTSSARDSSTFHSTKRFNKQDWRAYESANESFADAVAEVYKEGDAIWVHDYHLMLLPSLLRQRLPQSHIGWFLHTPFPTSDVYCRLPVRAQLLSGVLKADLVGFQTFDFERHFIATCQRLLGVDSSRKGIRTTVAGRDHSTSLGVFPIGINVDPFATLASNPSTITRVADLHGKFGGKRVILGIDRLDHIKGIPHKLLAMEELLNKYPEWRHNVVLIQIGLSSASADEARGTDEDESGNDKKDGQSETLVSWGGEQLEMSSQSFHHLIGHVNQLVGRINGTFGSIDYAPIHFIHQRMTSMEDLCALYNLADVCLVTSTRDGMNLVSHEFVACQQHFTRRYKDEQTDDSTLPPSVASASKSLPDWEGEKGGPGVLVLSEFAGSAQSLSGAVVVNPWNTEDLASSMNQALGMVRAEREIRQQKLYRYVSTNSAASWGQSFLKSLHDASEKNLNSPTALPKLNHKAVVAAYRKAKNRVIVLDYDKTLTPQHSLLPLAAVGPNFKAVVDTLSKDECNTVFVVSAHERKFLETWLSGVRIGVAAEDGFFYRMDLSNDREHWKTMSKFHYDHTSTRASTASTENATESSPHTHRKSSIHAPTESGVSGDSFEGEDSSWKDLVLPTMLGFTDRTPGSYIQDKESSLTWYYGDADVHFGAWQAKDLQLILERQLLGTALEVSQGNMYVSVEHDGCTKGKVLEGILKHLSLPKQVAKKHGTEVDFVLCVSDDDADEQVFNTLNTLVTESKERQTKRNRSMSGKGVAARARARSDSGGKDRARGASKSPVASKKLLEESVPLTRSRSVDNPHQSSMLSRSPGSLRNRKSQRGHRRRGSLGVSSEEEDLEGARTVDEDNKVAFSRLQKVPIRLADNASIFTVVAGANTPGTTRHASSYSVESLTEVRKLLKEFADATRRMSPYHPGAHLETIEGSTQHLVGK